MRNTFMMIYKRDRAMYLRNDGIKSTAGTGDMHVKNRGYEIISVLLALAFIAVSVFSVVLPIQAEEATPNYEVFIADDADLLDEKEESELYEVMEHGTEYGNMVFLTITDALGYNSSDYIEMIYQTTEVLAGTNAVIFIIDMDNRLLWISGYGTLKKIITPDYGNLITDNIYKYAGDERYGVCAVEGYTQVVAKLQGSRIAGSLRTLGNLSIAIILAAVASFFFAYITSVSRKASDQAILSNIERRISLTNPNVVKGRTEKIYDPPSSSSSGGGGSRGGGGGGGGFHGGGGGHGF